MARPSREGRPLAIDRMHLELGRVRMLRYKDGSDEPEETFLDLGVSETFEQVTNVQEVVTRMVFQVAARQMMQRMKQR